MNLLCALCGKPLFPETRWRIPLDICAGCGATWFDPGEFGPYLLKADGRIGATSNPVFLSRPAGLALPCPACRTKTLTSFEAQGIRLLSCSTCRGVLLPVTESMRLRAPTRPIPTGPIAEPELSAEHLTDALNTIDIVSEVIRALAPELLK